MTERFLVSIDQKRLTTWYKYSYVEEGHILTLIMEGKGYLTGKFIKRMETLNAIKSCSNCERKIFIVF